MESNRFFKEQLKSLNLKQIVGKKKIAFLVGAGCSIDPPSNLPSSFKIMEAIIEHTCLEKYKKKILELIDSRKIRFEALFEIFQKQIDPGNKLIEFFTLSKKPNAIHIFLSEMIKKGHIIMTTNFDNLIEYGLLQSKISKSNIIPVITKKDYKQYSNPPYLYNRGLFPIYKLHGCLKNIITGENTRNSLITTIRALGQNKKELNLFQLDSEKLNIFKNSLRERILIIIGYSGSDDFDIVPSLIATAELREIIWIVHVQKKNFKTHIEMIDEEFIQSSENLSKIDEILIEFKKAKPESLVYKVIGNTSKILKSMNKIRSHIDDVSFDIDVDDWIKNQVNKADQFQLLQIPYEIFYSIGMNEEAFRVTVELYELADYANNEYWKTVALNNKGIMYLLWNRYSDALECFNIVLKNDLQLPIDRIFTSHNKVICLKKKGMYRQGIAEIQHSLKNIVNEGNCDIIALFFSDLGKLFNLIGNRNKAKIYLKRAIEITQATGALLILGTTLLYFGKLYEINGDYKNYFHYVDIALSIFKKINFLNGLHLCHNSMGVVYLTLHQFDLALSNFQEALILAKIVGDNAAIATILNNLGDFHKMKGEYDKVIELYTEALLIDEKINDIAGMANRFRNIGHIHELKTKYALTRDFYNRSLLKSEELENPREINLSLIALGVLDYKEKKYNDALKNLVRAKESSEKRKDMIVLTKIYYNIALIYYDQDKIDDSYNELEKAFKLNNKLKMREDIMYNKLLYGRILNKRGDFREAITQLEESCQYSQQIQDFRHQGIVLQAMGLVRNNMGEYNLAIENFMKALKIAEYLEDFYGQVFLLRNIANCYSKSGNKSSAKSFLNCALKFFKLRKIEDPTLEAIIRNNLEKFS